MTIKVTYNVTDVYVTQDVSPVYINVSYSTGGGSSAAVWGSITGTLSDQTDLQTALDGKVPYTGATQDVSLGEYGINVGNVIYDTTPTGIPTDQGATYWDDQAETVALVMNGTIQKIGEDTFYHVKNSTGSAIAKGVAVRFAGTDGASGKLLIAPFLADGTYPSQYYMGITAEEITNGNNGKVYHFGKIRGINTSAFNDGDILYCSTTSAGGFQTTAPSAPNNIVIAAAVINAGNNGTLIVRSTTGSNINTDEGVLLTTPTSGQVLKYNGSLWVNDSVSGALGYTPANAATTLTINGVTYDLSANRSWTVAAGISGSGTAGQVAFWSGSSAVSGSNNLFWDSANSRLGIGTNAPASRLEIVQTQDVNGSINGFNVRDSSNIQANFTLQGGTASGSQRTTISSVANNTGIVVSWDNTINNFFPLRFLGSRHDFEVTSSNFTSRVTMMRVTPSAVLINTTTDNGTDKLQVNGGTLLKGSGNTSATNALTVQNSDSANAFRVRNDGRVNFGGSFGSFLQVTDGSGSTPSIGSSHLYFGHLNNDNSNAGPTGYWFDASFSAQAGGQSKLINLTGTFTGNTGAQHTTLRIAYTINQVSGATGITRGLYVNPTLTSAADWRSIEWSNNSGWGLYGAGTADNYMAGSLGIGSTSLTGINLRVGKNITGGTTGVGIVVNGNIQSDVTTNAILIVASAFSNTSGFNTTNVYHFLANRGSVTSTVTNAFGYFVDSTITYATNNYGFYGNIAEGSGRWNLYMNGTARNYLNGTLLLGSTTDNGTDKLQVAGSASFTSDIVVNSINVGRGNSSISTNTRIGTLALNAITSGGFNTGIGFDSQRFTTTGASNTSVGYFSLRTNTNGVSNTAIGRSALNENQSGNQNTALGNNAAFSNTTASFNSVIGSEALYNNTTGAANIAIGYRAGRFISGGSVVNSISNNSIFIGSETRPLADNETNQIVIGHQVTGAGSNSVTIGNTSITKTILRGTINAANLPTSSTGLVAGDLWNDAGTIKIV